MPTRSVPRLSFASGVAGLLCASLALLAYSHPLHAAESASPLAGSWVLEAADNIDSQGIRAPAFGPHPQGAMIVDGQGHYSLQIFRSNAVSTVAGRDVFKAARLVSSHFGQIHLDAPSHTLTFVIEMAYSPNWQASGDYSPNWNGSRQVRAYMLSANELSYRIPPEAGSGTTPVSVWRRMPLPK